MATRAMVVRATVAVVAIAALFVAASAAEAQPAAEKFTGFAINLNAGPRTSVVDFAIERWSTSSEREQLLTIIQEHKDPTDKLLDTLRDLPKVGYIRTPSTLAWDLRYAWQSPLPDGGRRIVLATDRPIGFREARNQPRTIDHPFTILEIRLDASNRGEGRILAGTKVYIDKDRNLVLENYGQQAIRFNEIRPLE